MNINSLQSNHVIHCCFSEELIGSADQRISDVLADVQATFASAEPINLGLGDDSPDIGSLQLSETQS